MSWTERQRLMLEAMGLKIWVPPAAAPAAPARGREPGAVPGRAAAAAPGDAAVLEAERVTLRQPLEASEILPVREPAPGPAGDRAGLPPGANPGPAPQPFARPVPGSASEPPAPRRVAEVLARALPGGTPARSPEGPGAEGLERPAVSREAVATLDWDALRSTVAGCQACRLCETRTQTVFGVGNAQAHWMVVGEAPGEQEDLQGEPFVGNAGKLLDNMLRALGLSRHEGPPEQQVYIANTLKCRPPRNRNPDPAELVQCEPYLQRQIDLIQPRIILAMGRFAVQQLLQSQEPIGRLRGRVHRYQGVPLVVTYHPAYLLRNLPDKARAWEDLCLARQTLEAGQ